MLAESQTPNSDYQTFCSGISFLQMLQTFVPLGYLALQFGQTIGFTKSVRAAACSGVLSGIRYHLLLNYHMTA